MADPKAKEQPPQPTPGRTIKCAVMPEEVFQMWIDSYRDALVPPKSSQPVMEALRRVQFAEFPWGGSPEA